MPPYVLSFLIGVVAGLRSLTPPAAVSWAARLGWPRPENTPLALMGFAATPYIFSVLALVESADRRRDSRHTRCTSWNPRWLRVPVSPGEGNWGKDLPIALIEDAIAIVGAVLLVR